MKVGSESLPPTAAAPMVGSEAALAEGFNTAPKTGAGGGGGTALGRKGGTAESAELRPDSAGCEGKGSGAAGTAEGRAGGG